MTGKDYLLAFIACVLWFFFFPRPLYDLKEGVRHQNCAIKECSKV